VPHFPQEEWCWRLSFLLFNWTLQGKAQIGERVALGAGSWVLGTVGKEPSPLKGDVEYQSYERQQQPRAWFPNSSALKVLGCCEGQRPLGPQGLQGSAEMSHLTRTGDEALPSPFQIKRVSERSPAQALHWKQLAVHGCCLVVSC
jgi:hypothetical protein